MQISDKDLIHFKETCMSVVNTIALLKSRFIRVNQALFINKEIMVRSKLRKKFLKVDPKVTKTHAINKEINALVF